LISIKIIKRNEKPIEWQKSKIINVRQYYIIYRDRLKLKAEFIVSLFTSLRGLGKNNLKYHFN